MIVFLRIVVYGKDEVELEISAFGFCFWFCFSFLVLVFCLCILRGVFFVLSLLFLLCFCCVFGFRNGSLCWKSKFGFDCFFVFFIC